MATIDSTAITTSAAWVVWTSAGTTAATSDTSDFWPQWCDTTSTASTTTAWTCWCRDDGTASGRVANVQMHASPAQAEQRRREAEQRRQEREAAENRANEALRDNLNAEQRREYEDKKQFHVVAADGERYRVRCAGVVANIDHLDKRGRVKRKLCAHPTGVPLGDQLLSQKLALECDPASFMRVANVS